MDVRKKWINIGAVTFGAFIILISIILLRESGITGFFIGPGPGEDPNLVMNLTFDDENDPWRDYSYINHTFTVNGGSSWVDRTFCKWYGCANFSITDGSDSLNSTSLFSLENGMAVSFWVYLDNSPTGGSSQGFFQIGEDSDLKWTQEGDYGITGLWEAAGGRAGGSAGASDGSGEGQWIHYFMQYDEIEYVVWKNSVIIENRTSNYGNLNYSIGEIIRVGEGLYNIDIEGYLDEFKIWNRSNFTTTDIALEYNSQRMGTPPIRDLFVKSIRYDLPVDWSSQYNMLTKGGSMDIDFTIANAGTSASGNFNYRITLAESTICSGTTSISARGELNLSCSWNTAIGFHQGYVSVDTGNSVSEDIENNNDQRLYIPFLDRPWFHFNLSQYNNEIYPYASDSANEVAYDSYSWAKGFLSEGFNENWEGNNVDPRAKKGRENGVGCLVNDYTSPSGQDMCERALAHLIGWSNRSLSTYSNVQAIHELVQVGILYDILYPSLTEQQNIEIVEG